MDRHRMANLSVCERFSCSNRDQWGVFTAVVNHSKILKCESAVKELLNVLLE